MVVFKWFEHVLVLEAAKGLFKAGIALLTVVLLTLEAGTNLLEYEKDAYKAKFEIEAIYKSSDVSKIDCGLVQEHVAACQLAQHQYRTTESVTDLANNISIYSFRAGYVFVLLAMLLYFFHWCARMLKEPTPKRRYVRRAPAVKSRLRRF